MNYIDRIVRHTGRIVVMTFCLVLTACGGSVDPTAQPAASATQPTTPTPPAPTYTIGGTLTGLSSGSVILANSKNSDVLTLSANGSYTFPTALAAGGAWNVIVSTQPTNQTCAVTNYQGSVSNANVTNIDVACSATAYTLSGNASGLASGQSLTVLVNGNPVATPVTAAGNFSLGTVPVGSSYAVTLQAGWYYNTSTSTGTYCYVQNGSGTASANVSNIAINCGAPPSQINLASDTATAVQNGVSYAGWYLEYPTVVNGELYYEVMYNGSSYNPTILPIGNGLNEVTGTVESYSGPAYMAANGMLLMTDMGTLQTLFNGTVNTPMGMAGDLNSAPTLELQTASTNPGCSAASCATNVTTLQAVGMVSGGTTAASTGTVTVAIPTLTQLQDIASTIGMPTGWGILSNFWSSTSDGSGMHDSIFFQLDYQGSQADSGNTNFVAFQVQ